MNPTSSQPKPVHEVRLGVIKVTVWRNESAVGIHHDVTFCRFYRNRDGGPWKSAESFGRDDLLVLGKVADLAHSWICLQQSPSDPARNSWIPHSTP